MKYYLYISDAKVDMLLPQISDAHKKKVATEYGIDLKIFLAKRKIEQEENEKRIARLEAVCSFIREFGNLGTVQNPDEYIEDSLEMRCMSYKESKHMHMVYFSGVENDIVIGLGGSSRHLFGLYSPPEERPLCGSILFEIMHIIQNEVELARSCREYPRGMERLREQANIENVIRAECLLREQGVLPQRLRFMAKRLYSNEESDVNRIIVGTPLYVAMDE